MSDTAFHDDGFIPFAVRPPPVSIRRGEGVLQRNVWLVLRYDGVQEEVIGLYYGNDDLYVLGTGNNPNPEFNFERVTHWKPLSEKQFREYD